MSKNSLPSSFRGLILFVSLTIFCSSPAWSQALSSEQALRARVQQFYTHLQMAQFSDALTLVTKATRNDFLNGRHNPPQAFTLDKVRFDPPDAPSPKKAEVIVVIDTFAPGSVTPVKIPETSNWVLEGGAWCFEAPKPHVASFGDLTKGGQSKSAAQEEVTFSNFKEDMGKLAIGQKGVATFSFKVVASHPVSLDVSTFCDCLVVKNLKKTYQPGETGSFRIEFDSTNYLEDYGQTIAVKTMPGGGTTKLLVTGFVRRPDAPKPEKAETPEKKPSVP